ncbi:MAG: YhjD/YihY/BrkB family envelope integrity protein [Phycisphaerae bacterium]|nr:YhjD/YihY/BrkB family envelope integrity protein [Phycisphaerae bacterium]
MMESVVERASVQPEKSVMATIIGISTLIVGALGVFGQLKTALNTIWDVMPLPGRGWRGFIRDRVLSFAMVLCIAFLLLISLAISGIIAVAGTWFGNAVPIGLYLGKATIVGIYGAAGSLVMLLAWVYYSAIIFLLGAEFTQVYARRRGASIKPSARAQLIPHGPGT